MPPFNSTSLQDDAFAERRHADVALMEQLKAGDRRALADLYDTYSRPLFSLAVRILSNATEAEDVIQEVFVSVWSKPTDYQPDKGSVFGWLIGCTRNVAIDRVRKQQRRSRLLDENAALTHPGGDHGSSDVAQAAAQNDTAHVLADAVQKLAPEQRRALELAYFSGLTQLEIAAELQEPLGTIKARIRRGLVQLRNLVTRME